MEDTTARWGSVVVGLGQSGTERRPVTAHVTGAAECGTPIIASLTMSDLHTKFLSVDSFWVQLFDDECSSTIGTISKAAANTYCVLCNALEGNKTLAMLPFYNVSVLDFLFKGAICKISS